KTTLPERPIRLIVAAIPRPESIRQRWNALISPSAIIEVSGLEIAALPEARTGVLLSLGEHRPFDEIANACQVSPRPDHGSGWPQAIETQELVLSFVKPDAPDAVELAMRFAGDQIAGSLVITDDAAPLYRGWIGPASAVHIPIAPRRFAKD